MFKSVLSTKTEPEVTEQRPVDGPEIAISDLLYSYSEEAVILKGISMNIRKPQLVSIIGPNGVGKSTLIHCMNKILAPVAGTVMIDGKEVKDYEIKELARKVGYVPYTSSDTFPMTVVDTILMGRNPHRKMSTLHNDLVIARDVMKMMDITHLAMRPFNELSAGQHQRVMLARGLAQEPEILLLDEPTANLDIRHQMDVIRLLKELSVERGLLVVMISHDLNIAAKYSDNVIMMSKGQIYAVGRPADVITAESVKEVYDVDSDVIVTNGRPFMMVKDPAFDAKGFDMSGDVENNGVFDPSQPKMPTAPTDESK